jgi:hypothetical protein
MKCFRTDGMLLSTMPPPDRKAPISESSIPTYGSQPNSRIPAPSGLPPDAGDATGFLAKATHVVTVTVLFNRIRQLFRDQVHGVNGHHFILLHDATGVEYNHGVPRVLAFKIVP